jgi:signal transduction histidine kinase
VLVTRRFAWALWVVAVAQGAFGLILAGLNRLSLERFFAEFVVSQTAAALAFATVGLLIAARRLDHSIGWLFCATGVGMGLTAWVGQYARYALVTQPGSLPAADVVAWLFLWTWVPVVALAGIFLPLLFPDGHLPSRRWRPALWAGIAGTALFATELALTPGPLDASLPEVSNPFALENAAAMLDAINIVALTLILASLASGIAAQVVRFRRARGEERQQLKWFAYATVLFVALFLTPMIVDPTGFDNAETGSTLLSGVLLAIAYPGLPVAVGIVILRYRLYDIDLIINRTLVYGALTASIVGVYVFVVGYLGVIFQAGGSLLVSLIATGIVVALFAPLREWLQRGVNRVMYGERDEPYRVISRLGERLEAALAPDAVLPSIVATVREALRLPYVAIGLSRDGAFEIVASSGKPLADALHLPLSYQGAVVGQLTLGPRSPGEEFGSADRRRLDDLAHHAGVAVHGVRVMADLQRSREKLVLAREEERRRIRRDLHDELAPTLAALGLTAATVGELIPKDPARASAVNAKLETALRTAVGDVRRLVYDLRPPTLDELGLVEAIRERADQYSNGATSDLVVQVEVPVSLPPLPAAVEVAAYRIVQEALTNVVRYSRARTCVIRLGWSGDELHVEIDDDGVGLPASYRAGVGLRSMEVRAAEVGGSCTVERLAPSGTRVSFRLPLPGLGATTKEESDGTAARLHR